MRFLIDECLHTSLVDIALARDRQAQHVNWIGLSGAMDWDLMPLIVEQDLTFVTNNARDFRRLYAHEPIHAGLVIIVPQVPPNLQRRLFATLLDSDELHGSLVNEAIEITIDDGMVVITRYGCRDPAEVSNRIVSWASSPSRAKRVASRARAC